jgi:cytochrome c oxidase subunit 2
MDMSLYFGQAYHKFTNRLHIGYRQRQQIKQQFGMDYLHQLKAVFTIVSFAAITGLRIFSQNAGSAVTEIAMTAQKYSFTPDVVRVTKDAHVKLTITALDSEHGFKLGVFNIDQKLKKGEATSIEFTADKVGTFPFQCSHFCGRGHGKMKGQLIVE